MKSLSIESAVDISPDLEEMPQVYDVLDYIYQGLDRTLRSMNVLARASFLQGCLPLLMNQVPADTLVKHVGEEKFGQLRACYREMSHLNLWYSAEIRQVLEAITAANIPVLVLKGADIATTLYPHPDLRYFDDVDLMVQPKDMMVTVAILEELGYSYHQEYRFEAISKHRSGFVYVKAVSAGYLMFELHTSPHSNELGISFDVTGVWERARPITIADVPVHGMSMEDLFIYLCWHCRSHSFDRLIWLYDIAIVLLSSGSRLDWGLLYRLARKQGLLATIYYTVSWCQLLWNIPISKEMYIEQYAPPPFVQRLIRRFVGEDVKGVLRRTPIRNRKLLQHLMVDDLRRLILVELRAIFPSSTHLGRRYMENSRLPLHLYWLYYFVHLFFAIKEALKALLAKIGRLD